MPTKGRNVIVLGTSAGGLEALDQLVGQLPADLPASIFIVQHMAAHNSGEPLLRRLKRHKAFQPKLAEDGDRVRPGRIYNAPLDSHLLVKKDKMLVTKGARENRHRPAIDPLFRSAAVAHGARVIGVVLTGMLDDGTAGLMAIKRCGGVTVVQDPRDAAYSGMPVNALNNVDVDFCVAVAEMGPLLARLVSQLHRKSKGVPLDIRTEAVIAERVLSDVSQVNGLGTRCRTTAPVAEASCGKWTRLVRNGSVVTRAIRTRGPRCWRVSLKRSRRCCGSLCGCSRNAKNLLTSMAKASRRSRDRNEHRRRGRETQGYIDRIRVMLLAPGSDAPQDTLMHVGH